ncbi:hypothetical protein EVAR_37849_1 [Eumeta japonica]|uniref:Uncharacterized protein n=1 Tax=Eumeta variegata TaxID=151549 RepID=A0A4C1X250_EUMVA|nr:hypothetical protein EVAR_37849_1 [Eumeta japonica]
MKYEAENGIERMTGDRWRSSKAVGVSERTVIRILKEKSKCDATGIQMESPHKIKKPRERVKPDIDESDKGVMRCTINNFHREYKQYPTGKCFEKGAYSKHEFWRTFRTLRPVVRQVLTGDHDVQLLRYKYLKQLMKYRDKNIVYTDANYIYHECSFDE